MLAILHSSTIIGVDAVDVTVEVDVGHGLPTFELVGLPSTSVKESRDRVRTAVKNAGFTFPIGRVTVNLAPAHLRKSGTLLDLPIAIGLLIASGQLHPADWVKDAVIIGGLSLNSSLRPIRGALCVAASLQGTDRVLIAPEENVAEICCVPKIKHVVASTLRQLTRRLSDEAKPTRSPRTIDNSVEGEDVPWSDVKGQQTAKRALQIAVAGGHHAMMMGPPGAGKTMLARGAASIGLPLTPAEAIDVSRVYSVSGLLSSDRPLIFERPFRAPHHTVTAAGLLGGGTLPRPGEISLAHKGILFLDEFAEFHRRVLDGLREPMEEGVITHARAFGTVRFPARFTLIAALNPCPCGFLHDPERPCTCRRGEIDRYRRQLSGPLLDRIDLFMMLTRIDADVLLDRDGTDAAKTRPDTRDGHQVVTPAQIERAVQTQRARLGEEKLNGDMTPQQIVDFCRVDDASMRFLQTAAKRFSLSPRALHRSLKVARTIADLEGSKTVSMEHLSESLAYRSEAVFSV